jgi:hypothetical protein
MGTRCLPDDHRDATSAASEPQRSMRYWRTDRHNEWTQFAARTLAQTVPIVKAICFRGNLARISQTDQFEGAEVLPS